MSNDYISREEALVAITQAELRNRLCFTRHKAKVAIRNLPAANVAPIVHSRWIAVDSFGERHYDWDDSHDWKCPVCNADVSYLHSINRKELQKYCHECGAKMDLGR